MNVKEFAALKVGDVIKNPMNASTGIVSDVTQHGVKVQWGLSKMEFMYVANSTAWMHWDKVEADEGLTLRQPNPQPNLRGS